MSNNNKSKPDSDTDSEPRQFTEFGGVADLNINIRMPNRYYEAIKAYCNIDNTAVRKWFNNAIGDMIQSIELGHVNDTFIEKNHLRALSSEKR